MIKSTNHAPRKTKSRTLRQLLSRKTGADIATLQAATGWQSHSVRAALSSLRKAGYTIDKIPPKSGGSAAAYRIAGTPEGA